MTEVTPHPLKTQGFHHFFILLFYDHPANDVTIMKEGHPEGRGSTGVSPKPSRVKRARLLYHSSRALVFYYAILFQHRFSSVFKAETITG